MATRPRTASRSRRDDRVKRRPGDDGDLIQSLDQVVRDEAKGNKRRRTARELARALPDVLDNALDLIQHLWP